MNILFICNEYPPGKSGGIGSITRALARGISASGHGVFVAGLYAPGYGQKDYEEDQGVKVWRRRFSLDKGLIRNNYSRTDALMLEVFRRSRLLQWDTLRSVRAFHLFLLDLIEKFRIDLVEWPDFNEYFPNLPASFVWPCLPVPLVVKFHGSASYIYHQMQEKVDPKTFLHEKKHLERADTLVSVSRNTAENYLSFYGLPASIESSGSVPVTPSIESTGPELPTGSAGTRTPTGSPTADRKIKVLYNSIEIPPLPAISHTPESSRTIVYTGALSRVKGIHSLIEAWKLVYQKRPDAILRIFGKGKPQPLLARLPEQARSSVCFEGFVTKEQVYAALSAASAAIFPSYTECFAIAPLEAMAVGCPVIFTQRVSGPELIDSGVNGLLIDPDNYTQMADAMLLLLEDAELQTTFSRRGRETVLERFDIRQSIKDHIRLYEDTIKNYKKHPDRNPD